MRSSPYLYNEPRYDIRGAFESDLDASFFYASSALLNISRNFRGGKGSGLGGMRNYFEELGPMPSVNFFTAQYLVRLWDQPLNDSQIVEYSDRNIYNMFYNNENMVYDKSKYDEMEEYDPNLMVYDDDNSEVLIKFIDDPSYKYERHLFDKNGKKIEAVYDPEDEDYSIANDWRVTSKSISESFTLNTLYSEFEKVPKFNSKILKTKRYDAFRFNTEMILPRTALGSEDEDDRKYIGAKGNQE